MERSYWFPSNFASKQIIFIPHIGEIYYKGLDIPSSIPLITRGFLPNNEQIQACFYDLDQFLLAFSIFKTNVFLLRILEIYVIKG